MRFAIFPLHLSKVLRLRQKSDAKSYEVLHLSRNIILANLTIWCTKMQPISGNQRPDLVTSLMNMSLVLRQPREIHLYRSSSKVPHLPTFLKLLQNPHVFLTFDKVQNPLRLPHETTSERPKVVWHRQFLPLLTRKWMCFAPQRRAIFYLSSGQMAPHPPWKNTVIRDFSTFSPTGIFFLLAPSLLWSFFFFLLSFFFFFLLFLLSSFFLLLYSFFFLLYSFLFLLSSFFLLLLLLYSLFFLSSPLLSSALLCSALLFSALLFSSLLFSSLLFSDSSHLCFFICPVCRKFDF